MKTLTVIFALLICLGCDKNKENKSGIICKWNEEHKICLCSTASPVFEEYSWKSETQFYAPNRVCGKEDTCQK